MVSSIQLQNVKNNEETNLLVNGVFIAVGTVPNTSMIKDVTLDQNRYIVADETGKTNIPGVFAVGDVRTKQLRQVVTAAADGANAITSVENYLVEKLQKFDEQ